MVAMRNMTVAKKPKGDEADEIGEPEGLEVHVMHEHLQRLGLKIPPSVGTKVHLEGYGEVTESHSGKDHTGKMRHHIRMTLARAGLETNERPGDRRADMRGDVEEALDAVAKRADAKRGKKIDERKGG